LTSAIDAYRAVADFSRQREITRASSSGTPAPIAETGAGASRRIADASSADDRPRNGRTPVASS
jgi:hypothetical protein